MLIEARDFFKSSSSKIKFFAHKEYVRLFVGEQAK